MRGQNAAFFGPYGPLREMQAVKRPGLRQVLVLLAGYVLLDWGSYVHPLYGLNITPWNPGPALAIVMLLRHGWTLLPVLALAIVAADVVNRDLGFSLHLLAGAAALAVGYWAMSEVLRRRTFGAQIFENRKELTVWAAIVLIACLLNSALYVTVLTLVGDVARANWDDALKVHWLGDAVGIAVTMPVLWMLSDARHRAQLWAALGSPVTLVTLLMAAGGLWLVFGVQSDFVFRYLYVLCLPMVWAATRQGMSGAVLGAMLVQLGIIACVLWRGLPAATVQEIQGLMLALALIGFFVGVVVDEKERVSDDLRQTLRMAAAGEMTGALAHELNQPLTALSAYGVACEQLLARGETGDKLADAIRRMVGESHRAADVVRRLRDFFRTGSTTLETVALGDLMTQAAAPFAARAASSNVELVVDRQADGTLLADRLQLEVVLRNLLQNAFDAVAERPAGERRVSLRVLAEGAGRACVTVEDSGAGFTESAQRRLFSAFQSTKTSGLGLGLVVSRAIVEAHGGQLWAETADHGIFKLMLPIEGGA
jgi:signal transduction histidine kinase